MSFLDCPVKIFQDRPRLGPTDWAILPRTKTKRRIFKKLKTKIGSETFNQSPQSYLGYLGHANSFKLTQQLKNQVWLWQERQDY